MTHSQPIHVHIFRRDLRLDDNTALYDIWTCRKELFQEEDEEEDHKDQEDKKTQNTKNTNTTQHANNLVILPLFIFTPQQVTDKNKYKSTHAIQFMIRSLMSLDKEIHSRTLTANLITCYGNELDILKSIRSTLGTQLVSVSWNEDYTPYSISRDNKMKTYLKKHKIRCETYHDLYLIPPNEGIVHPNGKPEDVYTVFTPFYRKVLEVLKRHPPTPQPVPKGIQFLSSSSSVARKLAHQLSLKDACRKFVGKEWNDLINVEGGRANGEARLNKVKRNQFAKYEKERDQLSYETTYLSAYLKFGCVSPREVYHAMSKSKGGHSSTALIRELIWRDYFIGILWKYPHVLGQPYYAKYKAFPWETRTKEFNAWKEGRTGFPVVDAGMRQLNETGYMHNRCRMIVSSFLVKLLRVDWRKGERYFAQQLVDYDVASNNGGWQDAFGSGAGAQPYYRIFNPWEQPKKYDEDAKYMKQWLPELSKVPADMLMKWDDSKTREEARETYAIGKDVYPEPVIDYKMEREQTLKVFKRVL